MRILHLLLIVTGTINCFDHEFDRENVLESKVRGGAVILPEYHLVTRQLSTDLYAYKDYSSVSAVFYIIDKAVSEARFSFHSTEILLSDFGSCSPNDVIINLKYGAFPAINPDGYDFPQDFIEMTRREQIHTVELLSDGKNVSYSIENPKPGIWYSISYKKWLDPKKEKIVQQGLVTNCETTLYSDLQVRHEEAVETIDCYANATIRYKILPALFKCTSLRSGAPISLKIKSKLFRYIYIAVEAKAVPTERDHILYCVLESKAKVQIVTFIPHPAVEHYILLGNVEGDVSRHPKCDSYNVRTDFDELANHKIINLVRFDKGRFFAFYYRLPSSGSYDEISVMNISSNEINSLKFTINEFVDIGGSLLISASLLMNLRYYMEYKRELREQSLLAFTQENQFLKTVICMDLGHPSVPLDSGRCKYNGKLTPALFVLNSIDSNSIYGKTYIPFPESGKWYLTFRLFCGGSCKADNRSMYNDDNTMKKEEEPIGISSEANDTSCVNNLECRATIVLQVSSMSCVNSKCSDHGDCRLHDFGGVVLSFCSCRSGYGGWDCSDTSRMDTKSYMLMSILFLTLSNLLFIFSVYVAIIRHYFTEAMIYALTMFFSTFYHACDAPSQVAFCIIKHKILQFGDFFFANMSFWVTLLAMSIMGDNVRSFLHLIGATVAALLLTWNTFSFICFVLPAAVGAVILLITWYFDYKKNRRMKYSKTYYFILIPLGATLIFIGFMCFAFLQTNRNYFIIHSIWHMIVAVTIVVLLPDVKSGTNENIFMPRLNNLKANILKYFHKSTPPAHVEDLEN